MAQTGTPEPPPATFVLVPGFWIGGWAWDDVAEPLRAAGHHVEAVTLPGLEDGDADRRGILLADHVAAVAKLVTALGPGVVLVGHSGGGAVVHMVTDQMPGQLRRAVYVDSGPLPDGMAVRPDLDPAAVEIPLPSWAEFEATGSSLAGLDQARLDEFRRRAMPHPAGPARDPVHLTGSGRENVPVTLITSSFTAEETARMAAEGHPYFSELTRLPVTYVDLPTGHWPMWSRSADLAAELARTAEDRERAR
jgi:pimeloyl-ACP methyl ester carboxylesterase